MNSLAFFNRPGKRFACLLGTIWVIVIGIIDWVTTPEIQFSLFYVLPIMFVAWIAGRRPGLMLAFFGGITWLLSEVASGAHYSHAWFLHWNALIRLGTFIVTSELAAKVAEGKRVERRLLETQNTALQAEVHERKQAEANLKELNETLELKVLERTASAEARSAELASSEAALRKQTGVLESILKSMGDGVIVVDEKGNILLFNPEAERVLQLPLMKTASDNSRNDFDPRLPSLRSLSLGGDDPLQRVMRGEQVDGAEIFRSTPQALEGAWLRLTARPLLDGSGARHGAVIVFSDITERKALEKQIAEISEREQRRIGQDLHDGLCQHLVSTAFACATLGEKMDERALPEAAEVQEIGSLVKDAIAHARSLARGLYPVQLEADGLVSALEELVETAKSLSPISFHFLSGDRIVVQDLSAASNLYRIAQEAINNAVKHSGGQNISLTLDALDERVRLVVQDDGIGLPLQWEKGRGMGMHIMHYRARMIGASLEHQRVPEGGTAVTCLLPCWTTTCWT